MPGQARPQAPIGARRLAGLNRLTITYVFELEAVCMFGPGAVYVFGWRDGMPSDDCLAGDVAYRRPVARRGRRVRVALGLIAGAALGAVLFGGLAGFVASPAAVDRATRTGAEPAGPARGQLAGFTSVGAGPTGSASADAGFARIAATNPTPVVKYWIVDPPVNGRKEFLFQIAEKALGNGNRFPEIFRLNSGRLQPDGGRMTDPNTIEPGWILLLPKDARGPEST